MSWRCFGEGPYVWDPVQIDGLEIEGDEQLGTKEKHWVKDAAGTRWLFKEARVAARAAGAPPDGVDQAEDWVECVVHALAGLMGVPSACIVPALKGKTRGLLSRSVLGSGQQLIHGNELLRANDTKREDRATDDTYSLDEIYQVLRGIEPATGIPGINAFDVWAGYVLLDAWVGGQDRHHENWAVVQGAGFENSSRWLAPSYDHGNALGGAEQLSFVEEIQRDEERFRRWVGRAKNSAITGCPTLVDLARDALRMCEKSARQYWLDRIASVSRDDVEAILLSLPETFMSDPRRTFVSRLLWINRERIF